jgi:hypothetical protein
MRWTLFLGAGSSRAIGYALTAEILPEIRRRLADPKGFSLRSVRDAAEELKLLLRTFCPDDAIADAQLPLITEVLSVVDLCLAEGEVLRDGIDLTRARRILEWAMADILCRPIHTPSVRATELVQWIDDRRAKGIEITVVSTNYDTSVDIPLLRGHPLDAIDIGFSRRDVGTGKIASPPSSSSLGLYKLHGSLNWLKCPRCGFIYVNPLGDIHARVDDPKGDWNTCDCEHSPLEMVLVAPSFVRNVREPSLRAIWQRTFEALRSSTRWLFVGYSLPPEDVAVRSLLLRARAARDASSREGPTKVSVFDPSPRVAERYASIFPGSEHGAGGLVDLLKVRE